MKRFKLFALALALVLVLGSFAFTGCGRNTGMDGDAYVLTFYRARSSNQTDGVDDAKVTKALEDKFFKDTGIKVKLTMKMYSGNDLNTQVDINYPKKDAAMEGISHYLNDDGGSAITKYAKEEGATLDLGPLVAQYGQHIVEAIRKNDDGHLAERAGYFSMKDGYKLNALPGVVEEQSFAILMRKDMMRQVQSVTGLDPDDFDVTEDGYRNMTFTEFYKVMDAIKNQKKGTGFQYPVLGAPWDIGRVFGTAFGVDSFNAGLDADGKFVPAQFTPDFDKYLMTMYRWAKEGIWEKDSMVNTDENRLTTFVGGKGAVYISYPHVSNLITVSRKLAQADPSAEVMVIAPLAVSKDSSEYAYLNDENVSIDSVRREKGELVVRGNLKQARAFQGFVIPFMAKNPEITIQFIDWLYADVENYELAKYGIKGEHWVEGEDKVVNGKTYKTWKYPDAMSNQYLTKPPYSGLWEILENINVSYRLRGDYNSAETKWYVLATQEFEAMNSGTEGVWMAEAPRSLAQQSQELGKYIENVRGKAWAGIKGGPNKDKTPDVLLAEYIAEVRGTAADYFTYINEEYQKSLAFYAENLK